MRRISGSANINKGGMEKVGVAINVTYNVLIIQFKWLVNEAQQYGRGNMWKT
jgi:hypothetical protein